MAKFGRRQLLLGAGLLAWLALWRFWPNRSGDLTLIDHPDVAGFRVLVQDTPEAVSRPAPANVALIGIGDQAPPVPDAIRASVAADPIAALYGSAPSPRIAYFTDIRCPICRPLEDALDMLEAEYPGLTRITHELPIFGDTSRLAARALIAAGPSLAPVLRDRLQRSAVALTEPSLAQILRSLNVTPDPVIAALYAEATETQLMTSRALAELLGFYGTPALVIGRTAVLGAAPLPVLRAILDLELDGAAHQA